MDKPKIGVYRLQKPDNPEAEGELVLCASTVDRPHGWAAIIYSVTYGDEVVTNKNPRYISQWELVQSLEETSTFELLLGQLQSIEEDIEHLRGEIEGRIRDALSAPGIPETLEKAPNEEDLHGWSEFLAQGG